MKSTDEVTILLVGLQLFHLSKREPPTQLTFLAKANRPIFLQQLYFLYSRATAEDECARFENRIKELHLEKEAVTRECTEIRAQLSLAEDKYDNAYAQLQDTMRKLKECELMCSL